MRRSSDHPAGAWNFPYLLPAASGPFCSAPRLLREAASEAVGMKVGPPRNWPQAVSSSPGLSALTPVCSGPWRIPVCLASFH